MHENQINQPSLIFAISLASRTVTDDWEHAVGHLSRTVASIRGSTQDCYSIVIALHETPDLSALREKDVVLLTAPFEVEQDVVRRNLDKIRKRRLIGAWLRGQLAKRQGAYVMFLDADDLVHRDLVEHVVRSNNHRSYIVDQGYVLDSTTRLLAFKDRRFHAVCGSCFVCWFEKPELPESWEDSDSPFSQYDLHKEFASVSTRLGKAPDPIPFPSVVYVANHENSLRTKQYRTIREIELSNVISPLRARSILEQEFTSPDLAESIAGGPNYVAGLAKSSLRQLQGRVRRKFLGERTFTTAPADAVREFRSKPSPHVSTVRSIREDQLPNFAIIGAGKSGTTSLYSYLRQHPDIYMSPVKEPLYFAFAGREVNFKGPGDVEMNRRIVTKLDDYLHLFRDAKGRPARGEASSAYLYYPSAAQTMRELVPNIKLIVILRSPAERAYSNFLHGLRTGHEPIRNFKLALEAEPERIAANWSHFYHYKAKGWYFRQLESWLTVFPKEQMLIVPYEELKNSPQQLLGKIFRFLAVEAECNISTGQRLNASISPFGVRLREIAQKGSGIVNLLPSAARQRLKKQVLELTAIRGEIPPDIRAELMEDYAPDVHDLSRLLGHDFSGWLRRSNPALRVEPSLVRFGGTFMPWIGLGLSAANENLDGIGQVLGAGVL